MNQKELTDQIKQELSQHDEGLPTKAIAKAVLGNEQNSATNRVVSVLRQLKNNGLVEYTPDPKTSKKPGTWRLKDEHDKLIKAAATKGEKKDLLEAARILEKLAASLRNIAAKKED